LLSQYQDRNFTYISVIIEDSPTGPNHDGIIDWKDAKAWADGDYNGDGVIGAGEGGAPSWPLRVLVLADQGGGLWARYIEPCGSDIICQFSCYVTPQNQIFDQGAITVDDTCSRTPSSPTTCAQCGYDEAYTKGVLEKVLPAQWCGTATP